VVDTREAAEEIEITPEMMEAGLYAYAEWCPGDWRPEAKIIDIYTAMARVAQKGAGSGVRRG
jgi:hypothetical protein